MPTLLPESLCVAASRPRHLASAMLVAVALTLLGARLPGAESPASDPALAPVAVVDGEPISLRQVEDALLKKEGSDGLTDWVQSHLAKLDWSKIKDSDTILAIGGTSLTRKELVLQMLGPSSSNSGFGGKVREDLINTYLVQVAIVKAHLTIDPPALNATWRSMESQFYASQKESKDRVDFSAYIRTKEGMDEEEFRRQPGFLMLAGLRKLAIQYGMEHVVESEVMAWFDNHRVKWDVQPAVRLADIFMPYQKQNDDERVRVMTMALSNYQGIASKSEDFAKVWDWLGKIWDPDAGEGGDIGWVAPDGRRSIPNARKLPQAVMDKAMAVTTLPNLLQPVASEKGVDLVRVDGKRKGVEADYKDVRGAVLMDMLETQLQDRMARIMSDLRAAAKIEYHSLPEAVERLAGP